MNDSIRYVAPLGRLLLSAIFLMSAANKIMEPHGTQGYIASAQWPFPTLGLLIGAIVFELGGGLSVLLGYFARWGAAALLVFLILASFMFHHFWTFQGMERQNQMIHFLKNVAIAGGLLLVIAYGAGPLSIDAMRRKSSE